MQETEIDKNVPTNILSNFPYRFKLEKSTCKKKIGLYVNNQVTFRRKEDLE
jgi:hypothetical protein